MRYGGVVEMVEDMEKILFRDGAEEGLAPFEVQPVLSKLLVVLGWVDERETEPLPKEFMMRTRVSTLLVGLALQVGYHEEYQLKEASVERNMLESCQGEFRKVQLKLGVL